MSAVSVGAERAVPTPEGVQLTRRSYALRDVLGRVTTGELWCEGTGEVFSRHEADVASERMREENAAALEQVRADGYISFPLFTTNARGEEVEKEAWLHPGFTPSCTEGFLDRYRMETNIYVPSYERAGRSRTVAMLDHFGVENYYLCIDPAQYEKYRAVYPPERLVIRDVSFRDPDMVMPHSSAEHPISMAGHAPLCNFTLALSRSLGESHFTFADDDFHLGMKAVMRDRRAEPYRKENYHRCSNLRREYGFSFQEFWHGLEALTKRLRNPGFVGLEKFGLKFQKPLSFTTGTRVFTFYITATATQVAHEGRQNNDVVTSLLHSRHGMVNLLFEGVGYNSEATQAGGGQAEAYARFGTLDKGKVLVRAYPDGARIVIARSRVHHSMSFGSHTSQRVVGAARIDAVPAQGDAVTTRAQTRDSFDLFREHREWTHYFNALRAQDLVQVRRADGRTDTYAGDSARTFLMRSQGRTHAEIDSMKQSTDRTKKQTDDE